MSTDVQTAMAGWVAGLGTPVNERMRAVLAARYGVSVGSGASDLTTLLSRFQAEGAGAITAATGGAYGGVVVAAASAGLGTAMTFNGSSGKIVTTALALVTPFTIELWAKRNSNATDQVLFGYLWGGGGDELVFWVKPDRVECYTGFAGPGYPWPYDTAWHHLACVCPGGAPGRVYVDGVTAGSDATAITFAAGVSKAFEFGFDAAATYFNGSLDEIAIYPLALTPTQIAAHYALGVG